MAIELMKSLTPLDELGYQITNLQLMGSMYDAGHPTTYKLVAVILRTLLIGSSGDAPLAEQCLQNPHLPRLSVAGPHTSPNHIRLPADIQSGSMRLQAGMYLQNFNVLGGSIRATVIGPLFGADFLPLRSWLDQPFLEPPLTLRDFIRTVAHKEGGAHVELDHDSLAPFHACGFLHWPFTAGMAHPVAEALSRQIRDQHPAFVSRIP